MPDNPHATKISELHERVRAEEARWALEFTRANKLELDLEKSKSQAGFDVAQMRGTLDYWRGITAEVENAAIIAEKARRKLYHEKERLLDRLIDIGREAGVECKHCKGAERWGTDDYEECVDVDCFAGWYIPFIPQVEV